MDVDPPELFVEYEVAEEDVDAVAEALWSRFTDLEWEQSPEEAPNGFHLDVDGRRFFAGVRSETSAVSVSIMANSDWACGA